MVEDRPAEDPIVELHTAFGFSRTPFFPGRHPCQVWAILARAISSRVCSSRSGPLNQPTPRSGEIIFVETIIIVGHSRAPAAQWRRW
jgi:hypothetical protein